MRYTKGEKTKQHVIEKAAEIFNLKGYEGTSVNDLRDATKLTSGVIYANFRGKQDLASHAFDYNTDKLYATYQSAILAHDQPDAQLLAFIEHPSKIVHKLFQGGCPILNMSIEADDALPWIREKVLLAIAKMTQLVENVLAKGEQQGVFHKMDKKEVSQFIFAAIEGSIMLAKANNYIGSMKRVENQLKVYIKAVIIK
ncbi:MAG: TetR/AcrR family transcriptional regulator [Cyclobacteriaceae bacterium]|nr:TetR/AcrR family transcriptional regulator [Cyclobacteriaceae bacterium HetDA_MAG_MS6]